MRLETMKLHNFGSFTDEEIDIGGITASVITGQNGAGKSTGFVDAPLWALFGKCRTGTDGMLQLGSDEMSVSVTFLINGERYRVIRKRSLKTKAGKSDLELQIADSESEWRSASGARLADTQEKICRLLNMDFELLTSTGFLLQGQADRFSRATPAERKAILAQILRLDQYGPLKQAASRHLSIVEMKHGEKIVQVTLLEETASTVDSLEARHGQVDTALTESFKAIEQLGLHQQDSTTKKALIAAELEQLEALPQQITELQTKRSTALLDEAGKAMRRNRAAKILDNRATIEAAVADEIRIKQVDQALVEEWTQLSGDLATAKSLMLAEQEQLNAIPSQRDRVRDQQESVREQETGLLSRRERAAKILENRETIEAKCKEETFVKHTAFLLEEERKTLALDATAIGKAVADIRLKLSEGVVLEREVLAAKGELDRQVRAYLADTEQLQREIATDERASTLLKQVPCGADLQGQCQFTLQAFEAERRLPAARAVAGTRFCMPGNEEKMAPEAAAALNVCLARQTEWQGKGYLQDLDGLETRLKAISAKQEDCEQRRMANRASLTELEQFTILVPELAAAEREAAQVDVDLVRCLQEFQQYTTELEQLQQKASQKELALADIEGRVTELAARKEACETQRATHQTALTELATFTVLVPELAAAEREVAGVDQDLAKLKDELDSLDREIERLQLRLDDRTRLTSQHSALEASIQQDTLYLQKLTLDSQTAIGRLKELELEIKQAQEAGRQARDLRQECEQLLVEGRQFQALITAYAQIPVLIMESAIPMLEEEANTILAKISTTGLRVSVNTQKALKSRDGLAETLDIAVRDVFGERMLENFSGGERARVDLAVRIGLSKLLANRAGARLETLVVDEAFAAVDREGVEQLVECLPMLSEEFPLILFITHDEGFKSSIAQQILVSKDHRGSHIAVLA